MSDVVLFIDRLTDTGVQSVGKGRLVRGGRIVMSFDTLELGWKNNRRRVSCIPPGPGDVAEYRIRHRHSPRFDRHLDVVGEEPQRDFVLIHAGNTFKHTVGCILVGRGFGDINDDGHPDVLRSRVTLDSILAQIPLDGARLVIRGVGAPEHAPEPEPPPPVEERIIEPLRPRPPAVQDEDDIPHAELLEEVREAAPFTVTDVVIPDTPVKTPLPMNTSNAKPAVGFIILAWPVITAALTGLLGLFGVQVDASVWATFPDDGVIALAEWLAMARDIIIGVVAVVVLTGPARLFERVKGWFRKD